MRAAAAALGLLLAGCAVDPITGDRQFTLVPPGQDAALGAREHPKVVAEYGGAYEDGQVQALVERVGARVASASGRAAAGASGHAAADYTFTVLDSPVVNAFALPGGYVYVTRGLLALVGDEAELAGVLGHEIAHVAARHSAERATQSTIAQVAVTGLAMLGLGPAAGQIAGTGADLLLKGYSRNHELEADALGLGYMNAAGYDPRAMAGFLATMERDAELQAAIAGRGDGGQANPLGQWLSTHPQTRERVERASTLARDLAPPAGQVSGRGRDSFLDAIDGMVYGDSPEQGIVRGRSFVHPELGFRFEVPEGFRLVNGTRQVIAAGPEGSVIVFDADRIAPGADVADYLTRDWGDRMPLRSVETITVNGMPAATATARGSMGGTPVDARLLAIRFAPDTVYRFVFLTPPGLTGRLDVALRETTYSFRRLDDAERGAVRSLRLRVHTVRPGETAASLAAGLPFDRFAEERLRVLNALPEGTQPEAGRRIKLIE